MTIKHTGKDVLWSPQFILLVMISLLVSTGHYMLMATLPIYVVNISGNRNMAGLMVTMLALSALVFRPYFGNLMDARGRKLVLVIGASLLMATALLYNFVVVIPLLFVIRFIQGSGFSAHTTSSGTIVADLLPGSRLSEGIGYFSIANTVATAIGPFVGLYCVERFGYKTLFIWVFSLSLLSFLSTLFVDYEKKKRAALPSGRVAGFGLEQQAVENPTVVVPTVAELTVVKPTGDRQHSFMEASAIRPSITMFFIALTFGAIITYIPSFGISRKIDNIGIFFTIYACAVLVSRTFTGRLADKRGFTKVMLPGMLSLCLSLVVLAFAHSLLAVIAAGALYGFGYGICYPLSNAIVIRLCPIERRGAATATIFAAMDLGIGMGAFLWGWVAGLWGYTMVYLLAAVCVLASFWVYAALVFKRIPGESGLFRSRG